MHPIFCIKINEADVNIKLFVHMFACKNPAAEISNKKQLL